MGTFRPDPKPPKREKKQPKPLKRTAIKKPKASHANTFRCSNGERVTQATIERNLSKAYAEKHSGNENFVCEGCGAQAIDNSHIIAKARCKELGITEMIWCLLNFFNACRTCHHKWENYKTGEFWTLKNIAKCMAVLEIFDPEAYQKRLNIKKPVF